MKETMKVGIGQTPQLCQDALIEMLRELFAGKKYNGQEGRKPLAIFKQDLPIPEENDVDADTDVAHAPYIVVRMTGGEIADDKSPQTVEFSLIICAYDTGIERAGFQDVANIKEDIVQRACTAPYFGGAFTILKPIAWALQQDDTAPYYYGAVTMNCTAPAMTQDTELEGTIPAALADFIQAHPAAKGLLVSVGRFAQVRSNLGRSGTAEAILFQKIKSEL